MKKVNLSLLILMLLFSLSGRSQTIDLETLKKLRTISLIDMHDVMLSKGFSLIHIDKNKASRVDSIVYANDENYKITYQLKKKSEQNTISLIHQDNDTYQIYSRLLKGNGYVLLNSEILPNKGIQSFFYCKRSQHVIVAITTYDSQQLKNKGQSQSYIYHILSTIDSKSILRKYKSKLM